MDDDKIRSLFNTFEPQVTDSSQFIRRLNKHLMIAEAVRNQNAAMKRRNRVAVAVAAVSGFAMGVILTLMFPYIREWIASIDIALPRFSSFAVEIDYNVVTWVLMAAICVLTSMSAYEVSSTLISRRVSATGGSAHSQLP